MYVKLFSTILDSSVWGEDHATVRLWITLLCMADPAGVVRASFGGLARRAGITREECKAGLAILEGPDLESKDPDFGGRRVDRVDGGWRVLNYLKYREIQTPQQRADADRARRYRERHRESSRDTSRDGRDASQHTEAEAEADTGSVPTEPARAPAADPPWNTELALLLRQHLVPRHPPEWSIDRDLSICKAAIGKGIAVRELAAAIRGLPLVCPTGLLTLKLLYAPSQGEQPLFQRAVHAGFTAAEKQRRPRRAGGSEATPIAEILEHGGSR